MRATLVAAAEFAVWLALWLLLTGVKGEELAAAAICALLSTAAIERARKAQPICFDAPLRALWPAVKLPGLILHDTFIAFVWLLRPRRSRFRSVPFDSLEGTCRAAAKRALATTYVSIPPNSVVIGFNREAGTILYHELMRTPPPSLLGPIDAL